MKLIYVIQTLKKWFCLHAVGNNFCRVCFQIFTMCPVTVQPTGTTIRNPVTCLSFGTSWNGLMLRYTYLVSLCVSDNRKCNGNIAIHLFSLLIYEFKLVSIINIYDCNVFTRVVSLWAIFLSPIVQHLFIQLLPLNLSYILVTF